MEFDNAGACRHHRAVTVIEGCARPLGTGSMTVADMPRFLFRVLEKLFPVQPHEWPKAFLWSGCPLGAALREHLPSASPAVTAAALTALADSGGQDTMALVRLYMAVPHAQVRLAALAGLQRLGDPTLPQRAVAMLDDPDVQVQAAALALVLATPGTLAYTPAQHQWEAMLDANEDR